MTKFARASIRGVLVTAMVLAGSGAAFAGKNGGDNSASKSNAGSSHATKNAPAKKSKTGKVSVKEFTIKKATDKTSPN